MEVWGTTNVKNVGQILCSKPISRGVVFPKAHPLMVKEKAIRDGIARILGILHLLLILPINPTFLSILFCVGKKEGKDK